MEQAASEKKNKKPLSARDVLLGQERRLKITTIATVVIAFATLGYIVTTLVIIWQMKKDNDLQRDYYEKTTRPFVHAHTLAVTHVDEPVTKDSKVKLAYHIKNVGALPAKEIRNSSEFEEVISEKFKGIKVSNIRWDQGEPLNISGLYPEQETLGFPTYDPKIFTVDNLMRHKFAHIVVLYSDTTGRKYYHKWIVEMRMSIESGKLKFQALNKWVDFD